MLCLCSYAKSQPSHRPIMLRSFTSTSVSRFPRSREVSIVRSVSTSPNSSTAHNNPLHQYHHLVSLIQPASQPVPPHLRYLKDVIATSFLPKHQPFNPAELSQTAVLRRMTLVNGMVVDQSSSGGVRDVEQAIVLASPFDGGDAYLRSAVEQVSGALQLEVLRLDLPALLQASALFGK